jgi:hypothetical protein
MPVQGNFLPDESPGKNGFQLSGLQGFPCRRVERRLGGLGQVGLDIVKMGRKIFRISRCESHDVELLLKLKDENPPERGKKSGKRSYRAEESAHQSRDRRTKDGRVAVGVAIEEPSHMGRIIGKAFIHVK